MIEVTERIEVPAAPQVVWGVLSDPYVVVECVPGAAVGDKHEDGSYDATFTVKFGPAKVAFRARFTLELNAAEKSGKVDDLHRQLVELARAQNKATDGTTSIPATFMRVTVVV